jgi:hypothetical protein
MGTPTKEPADGPSVFIVMMVTGFALFMWAAGCTGSLWWHLGGLKMPTINLLRKIFPNTTPRENEWNMCCASPCPSSVSGNMADR